MGEYSRKSRYFAHPGRHGGFGFRRNLDLDRSIRHTFNVSLRKKEGVVLSYFLDSSDDDERRRSS
jgi:hypothetical protein